MHPAYCIALTGLATAKFVRDGSPKKDRVAYLTALLSMYENCDPRHVDELVTGDETWLYYSEPLRKAMEKKKAWVPKGWDTPQIVRRCSFEKNVCYTIFFFTQMALCYRNHARQERASWGNAAETVLLETNKIQKTSPNPRHVWNQTSS